MCQKYEEKGYMEMGEQLYLEPWKSVLGRSILYYSTFHVNIITGSGVMVVLFYNGLTRNPEIGNIPVWVLPNIRKLARVMDTNFGMDFSKEMSLNPAK